MFLHEIGAGMAGTSVRGTIKVATSGDQPGKYEQCALEAGAIASRASGTGIITHSERVGEPQCHLLSLRKGDVEYCASAAILGSRLTSVDGDPHNSMCIR